MVDTDLQNLAHTRARKRAGFSTYFKKNYSLYVLLIPALVYYLVFKYVPMYGVVVAFKDYNIFQGVLASPWAGLDNFRDMISLPNFLGVVRNTLMLSGLSLIIGFPVPIILSLMLNELRYAKLKKAVQSVLYIPHFMSWIVLSGIIINLLSPQYGFVNNVLRSLGLDPVFFMAREGWWVVTYVASNIWQSAGWQTIIFMAALSGIDPTLYEVAIVDGANRWQLAWRITIPSILPTIVIMFILRVGRIVTVGFEQPMALYNALVADVAEVISTFIYHVGVQQGRFALTTAIGLAESFVNLLMILAANYLAKKVGEEGLF